MINVLNKKNCACLGRLWVIVLAVVSIHARAEVLHDMNQLQWKHRVLIVWSDDPGAELKSLTQDHDEALNDRDMVLFVMNQSDLVSNIERPITDELFNQLKNRYSIHQGRYFLIGKDGGLKMSGEQLFPVDVFDEIDRMPMRKREMQQ